MYLVTLLLYSNFETVMYICHYNIHYNVVSIVIIFNSNNKRNMYVNNINELYFLQCGTKCVSNHVVFI